MGTALIWIVLAQSAPEACGLIQGLRSESVEEREGAEKALKSMGRAAVPELEKAANHSELEVAQRAKRLLRVIAVMETLTPNLMKAVPGLEDRIAEKEGFTTLEALGEVEEAYMSRRRSGLRREDLEAMALASFRRCMAGERPDLCRRVGEWRLTRTIPDLVALLKGEDRRVTQSVVQALWNLESPEGLSAMRSLLKEERKDLRASALNVLREWASPGTIADVAACLIDPAPEVRSTAIHALESMRAFDRRPALLRCLKDPAPGVRAAAAESVVGLGSKGAVPAIVPLLKDEEPWVRRAALHALVSVKAPEAGPELLSRLRVAKDNELSEIESLLKQFGGKELVPDLVKLVDGEDSIVRRIAIETLGSLGAAEAAPVVARRLKEDNEDWVRLAALSALQEMGAKDRLDEVAALMSDDSPALRSRALWVAAELGGKRMEPEILKRLKDESDMVRCEAASVLARLGSKGAVPQIAQMLQEGSEDLRSTASRALARLGSVEHAPAIVEMLKDRRGEVRWSAQAALVELNAKEAVPALVKLLPERATRAVALEVLGELRAREAVPSILPLLRSGDPDLRGAAVQALGGTGDPDVIAALIPLLEDEVGWIRACAVQALGGLAPREVVARAGELIDDGCSAVRTRTIEVLARERVAERGPALVAMLEDPDDSVREQAARALCLLGRREGVPWILRRGGSRLLVLNAVRKPEAWRRLEEKTLEGDWKGTPAQGLDQVARESGLWLEGVPRRADPRAFITLRRGAAPLRLLDLLERSIPSQAILECDRLRLVPEEEARAFWESWQK